MTESTHDARWGLVLLPLRPWTLARQADGSSVRGAIVAGACWAFLLFGFLFSVEVAAASEPHASLGSYLGQAFRSTLICGLLGLPVALPIVLYIGVLSATAASERSSAGVRRFTQRLLVTHVALALPLVAWGVVRALHLAAPESFGLAGQAKPEWIHSDLLAAVGSWWAMAFFAVAYLAIAWRTTRSETTELA